MGIAKTRGGGAMTDVERFYDDNADREAVRLDRHRTEFAVTMHAITAHMASPADVLDIGGGPGRYALSLASQGYVVSLVDLSQRSLDLAQQRARELGVSLAVVGRRDAIDLSGFPDTQYDVALLLGPLYHLLTEVERARTVREAWRILRPGGVALAAFLCRYALIRYHAKRDPIWLIEGQSQVAEFLATGVAGQGQGSFADAYFARPSEIVPFMERHGFDTIEVVACEGVTSMIDEQINALHGEAWEAWVTLNYQLGKDPSVHGGAEHLLYVGRKRCEA